MAGAVHRTLSEDHARLGALLDRAARADGSIDLDAYLAFRAGLARHIGIEEKILFPAARRRGGDDTALHLARLRADHARLGWLIVWTPTPEILAEIRSLLEPHDRLEEETVYAACEALLGAELDEVLAAVVAAPEVPMRPLQPPRQAAPR
jgi:hypothetical protein